MEEWAGSVAEAPLQIEAMDRVASLTNPARETGVALHEFDHYNK